MKCKCYIKGHLINFSFGDYLQFADAKIIHCPKHAATDAMLEALKEASKALSIAKVYSGVHKSLSRASLALPMVEEAIALAEGKE